MQYCNLDARGFVLCHLTKAKFHTEFHFVSNVQKKKYSHFCGATFAVKAGERGQMHRAVRYMVSEQACNGSASNSGLH
jgi:phosphodiesterase/alkaline phosphatase D-like protein